jgi:hypothetical protein
MSRVGPAKSLQVVVKQAKQVKHAKARQAAFVQAGEMPSMHGIANGGQGGKSGPRHAWHGKAVQCHGTRGQACPATQGSVAKHCEHRKPRRDCKHRLAQAEHTSPRHDLSQRPGGWVQSVHVGVAGLRVCVFACLCVCVFACLRVCVFACLWVNTFVCLQLFDS